MNPMNRIVVDPVVATSIAIGLCMVEQTALWGATIWNIGVTQIELGARLAFPSYPQYKWGSITG